MSDQKPTIILQKDYDEEYFKFLQSNKIPKVNKDSKIIFLDVDGVLNSDRWIDEHPETAVTELIDPAAAAKVNTIIAKTGAQIVISSSWRIQFLNEPNGFEKLKEFFAKFGITNIVGMTPRIYREPRCQEIAAWLMANEVAAFVIIDDDGRAQFMNKLVKTTFIRGLQDYHVEEAIAILNEKRNEEKR